MHIGNVYTDGVRYWGELIQDWEMLKVRKKNQSIKSYLFRNIP